MRDERADHVRPLPKAWTSSWQMFVVYSCILLGASMLPLWPVLQGAFLTFGAFCAFAAGTLRTFDCALDLSWRREHADRNNFPEPGTPVVVTHPDSGYIGRRGVITGTYTDSPAALASGCPILDVMLVNGPMIIVPATAVEVDEDVTS